MRFILLLFFGFAARAQQDSVAFTVDSRMDDGVYVTYDDFKKNHAITKEQIESPLDKEQLNFLEKALQRQNFSYMQNGIHRIEESKNVWGFFQNNTFYVNYKGEFYRVPVFGSISYFVAMVLVPVSGGFGMGYGMGYGVGMGPSYTKELREFLIDANDGAVTGLSSERLETLLGRDSSLYAEYKGLSRRKRKDQLYHYIRKYDALHPIYFVK